MIVHAELAAIAIILLCAAIMAKGGWCSEAVGKAIFRRFDT
jgi:hypothetical protein